METNIDPRLQEDDSTVGPVEELVNIQVDPNEPNHVIKMGKILNKELAQHPIEFLHQNQDMFAWTHTDMIRIRPKIMRHRLTIDPHAKPVHQIEGRWTLIVTRPFRMR